MGGRPRQDDFFWWWNTVALRAALDRSRDRRGGPGFWRGERLRGHARSKSRHGQLCEAGWNAVGGRKSPEFWRAIVQAGYSQIPRADSLRGTNARSGQDSASGGLRTPEPRSHLRRPWPNARRRAERYRGGRRARPRSYLGIQPDVRRRHRLLHRDETRTNNSARI